MAVDGIGGEGVFLELERDARVSLAAVPEGMVLRPLDDLWHLGQLRLQLLETYHIRLFALHPLVQLCGTRAYPVDVPRSDFHRLTARSPVAPDPLAISRA